MVKTGVVCTNCTSEESYVIDSRPSIYGIRRQRGCYSCGQRYTTLEVVTEAKGKGRVTVIAQGIALIEAGTKLLNIRFNRET